MVHSSSDSIACMLLIDQSPMEQAFPTATLTKAEWSFPKASLAA